MGQKVNPILFRLGKTKTDSSVWSHFSDSSSKFVFQDLQLRDFLNNLLKSRGILLRSCSISRSHQKIDLNLDIYFSYIFSKQAKFCWARSLFQSIKKKYTKIHKIKDVRVLASTFEAFGYLPASLKPLKYVSKLSRRLVLGRKKNKFSFFLKSKKDGLFTKTSKLLFFFFGKSGKRTAFNRLNESESFSFFKTAKLTNPNKIKYFRYNSSKLSDLFLLPKVSIPYQRSSLFAPYLFSRNQCSSITLLKLNKQICQSVQKYTGVERVCLRLTSQQLLFLPIFRLYRQALLKELAFFQKNKDLSKYFFEIIESSFFLFVTFGFGNAFLLTSFIKYCLESSRKQLLFVKLWQKVFSVLFDRMPAKIRAIEGIKILIKGRFNKRRRTKTYVIQEGQISLQTVSLALDYHQSHAITIFGSFGIKVWISKRNVISL